MRPLAATWQVLAQALLGAGAAISAFILLDEPTNNQLLISISALGGATGSCLYPLVSSANDDSRDGSGRTPITPARALTSPVLFFVVGIVVGAVSLMLTLALLVGDDAGPINMTGALTFGVLAGALGSVIVRGYRGVGHAAAGSAPPIIGALSSLDNDLERVVGRRMINYDGTVIAGWYPTPRTGDSSSSGQSLIIARIVVTLVPRKVLDEGRDPYYSFLARPIAGRRSQSQSADAVGPSSPAPAASAFARVTVQGGDDAPAAPFTVTMFSSDLAVVPARADLPAPRAAAADPIEFTVLRNREHGTNPATDQPSNALILVDLSQGGTTVQLVELDTSITQG